LSWLGRLPPTAVDHLLAEHDVLLLPTRYEACSMTVLEALAAGLPVIGSPVIDWQIKGCGEIVSGEDPATYAAALCRVGDADRRREMARAGLLRAREFSWDKAVAHYIRVLDLVMAE
jgi:glycosyltransferase involved in cell wall biosynthesis